MGRKIGLDVGDRTIGVAVSDALGVTAQGITTIERVGIKKDTTKVADYIREYDCDTVVIEGVVKRLKGKSSKPIIEISSGTFSPLIWTPTFTPTASVSDIVATAV